jgi:REP element-mobilizing transposase RayT
MLDGYKIRDQFRPHFVTFTVTDWVDVFSRKIYRDIVIDSFKYCQKEKGLFIFGYCIMSNHIHAILQSHTGELSKTIGELKRHCSKAILKTIQTEPEIRKDWMLKRFEFAAQGTNNNELYKFWRNGNHPEEILTTEFFWTKLNYIHMNPVRSGIVCKAHHYLYCSASNYIIGTGLLNIEIQSQPNIFVSDKNITIDYELW